MQPVVPHQGMTQHEETPGFNEKAGNKRSLFYSHPPPYTVMPKLQEQYWIYAAQVVHHI